MHVHKVIAMVRQDLLTRVSYRFQIFASLASLFAMLVPLYFVSKALHPMMESSIRGQGNNYFAFVLIGMIVMRFCYAIVNSLPAAFSSAIRSGTLEALFATPTTLGIIFSGMVGFTLLWTAAESLIVLAAGALLGVRVVLSELVPGFAVLVLILLTHLSFGVFAVALVLVFRTTGGLLTGVLVATNLLGGVYYPTHVIPSWIENLSAMLPLTYGLRALRRLLLEGAPVHAVSADIAILVAFLTVLLPCSWALLRVALAHARRTGSLAHY